MRNSSIRAVGLIASLLILLALTALFTSCDSPSDGAETTPSDVLETTPPLNGDDVTAPSITLVENGKTLCSVIRPENGFSNEADVSTAIYMHLSKIATAPSVNTDWLQKGESYDESAVEILIGYTGHQASIAAYEDLGYGEFRIKADGSKLVVAAWTEQAFNEAANYVTKLLSLSADNTLTILPDLDVRETVNEELNAIPVYTAGNLDYIQPVGNLTNNPAMQLTVENTSREEYDAYCSALIHSGFTEVQQNSIGEVKFMTFTRYKEMITAYHMGGGNRTRIILEPTREIAAPNKPYTPICDTTLWQLGLDSKNDDIDSSMNAYIVRLADGRFVLFDTGEKESAKYQIEYLKSMTEAGEKPVIAAIFVSHPHVDHVNGLLEFAATYKNDITVESVYFNYGCFEMQDRYVESSFERHWSNTEVASLVLGASVYVVRSGQRVEIADAVIETLWTPEDFGNKIISDYNDASVVFRMTVGDKVVLFLGDCRDEASPIVVSMYGDALKCDIITVAHHGYTGSVSALYRAAAPEIVLWPNFESEIDDNGANKVLLALESVKQHIFAGDGDATVTLAQKP